MKYEAAERQLAEVREEISRCEAELAEDQGCEERFWQVLAEKREAAEAGESCGRGADLRPGGTAGGAGEPPAGAGRGPLCRQGGLVPAGGR